MKAIWYFREGTEDRIEVLVLDAQGGLPQRWVVQCGACGTNFTLRPEHGISVGPDGALPAVTSFNCPKCMQWHRHISGGVVQP